MNISLLRRQGACILGIVSACAVIPAALAADYPDKPVRIIVPSAPGGGTDTTMKISRRKAKESLFSLPPFDFRLSTFDFRLQAAVRPPSSTSVCPVMYSACGLAR